MRDVHGRPNARLAAARVLLDVAAGRRADSSLEIRAAALSGPDRALCQEIAFGALRWRLLLDHRLDPLLTRGIDSLPLTVRAVLEVASYQLLFLDRVPAYAVLDDAVEHVRVLLPPRQARGLTGVVNAALRALASEPSSAGDSEAGGELVRSPKREHHRLAARLAAGSWASAGSGLADDLEKIAILTSHPLWIVERWLARFGAERGQAILESDNRSPGLHLRPRSGRASAPELLARLRAEGAAARLHPLYAGCVVLQGGDPTGLDAYREGLFSVQDVSAQLVAALASELALESGVELRVELCAAPGGKTAALAEPAGGGGVLAVDVSPARLRRLVENTRRLDLPVLPVAADARSLALSRGAGLVLADVPCLGTGTFRRRVDARWQKSPAALPELVELQAAILENAAGLLAPRGRLLYSTCSLEPEENEAAVCRVLAARDDLRVVDLAPRLGPRLTTPIPGAGARALFVTPEMGDCDGAFAALLERTR